MSALRERNRYQNRIGFTLIELLVVIAIIAILAAILFPVFLMAQRSGLRAACQSNMKEIATACLMYADNWGGRTPGSMWVACSWDGGLGWTSRLAPYLGNKGRHAPTKGEHRVYQCPAARNVDYSYAITDYSHPRDGHAEGMIIAKLKFPSRQMLFYELRPIYPGESGIRNETGQSNDGQEDGPSWYTIPATPGHPNTINNPYGMLPWCVYWPGNHSGGQDFAMADGHVTYLKDWNSQKLTYTDSPPK